MLLYTLVMLAISVMFLVLGIAIFRGHTDLIHDYHQKNIPEKDLPEYGRAFSWGMFSMSFTLLLSGLIPLSVGIEKSGFISMGILVVGFLISFIILAKVQKKYNGGFF